MDLAKRYTLDTEKATNGVWREIDGTRFLIAYWGWGNTRFELESKRLMANPMMKPEAEMTEQEYVELQDSERKAFANSILLDWENLTINGELTPYDKELACDVLKAYPQLWIELKALSFDQNVYARETEREIAKNS